jgi:hypothetical protein
MAEGDALTKRGRALEDEYFWKQEKALIEKLRARAAQETARRQLSERSGVADQEILADLQGLGYTPETIMLLHLVPLLQIAWAEGGVSEAERRLIVEAARSRGVEPGSAADRQLADWLETRPSDAVFESTIRAIRAILEARPPEERDASRRDLLTYADAIASASGGILGFGKISEGERQILTRIATELERNHADAARRVMAKGGDS